MQPHDFGEVMKELKLCFGENKYSDARTKKIWSTIQDFDAKWFIRLAQNSILNMKDINWSEEIAKERERQAERIKQKERQVTELHPRHDSMFSKEEIAEHMRVMKGAASGMISRRDALLYAEALTEALLSAGKLRCKKCYDIGVVSNYDKHGYETIVRCVCVSRSMAVI